MQPNALLIRQNFIVVKSGCYTASLAGELQRPIVPGAPCADDAPLRNCLRRRSDHRGGSGCAADPQPRGSDPRGFSIEEKIKNLLYPANLTWSPLSLL
jgi:hypothetical protein